MGWLDEVRARPLTEIAKTLGYQTGRNRLWPCPACGADRRGDNDKRVGPVWLKGPRWGCGRPDCSASEGKLYALDLIAMHLGRTVPVKGDTEAWRDFREAVAGLGLCTPYDPKAPGERPVQRPVRRKPDPVPVPQRSADQVRLARAIWEAGDPSPATSDVLRRYCIARGYGEAGAFHLGRLGMIRAAPRRPDAWWPAWARFKDGEGSALPNAGWSILVPVYSPTGELVDVRFRWAGVEPDAEKGWRATRHPFAAKSMAGRGEGRAASTAPAACPVARALLGAGRSAAPGELAPGIVWSGAVWLLEGETDTWAVAAKLATKRLPSDVWPAILAYGSGTWTAELANRLPDVATVVIWPDADKGGREMANKQLLPTLKRHRVREVNHRREHDQP